MASLRSIRTRIKSVRNTQKITKAMKLVDAAKLRGAQDAVIRARPYAQLLGEMLGSLASSRVEAEMAPHPLMETRPLKRVEVVMLTSDRGLCGGFNSNIVRRAQRFVVEDGPRFEGMQFSTIGRKGRDFARKRGFVTRKDYVGFFAKLRFPQAKEVADDLIAEFLSGRIDGAFLLYNQFKSAISQTITLTKLLPIEAPAGEQQGKGGILTPEHLFEPGRKKLLDTLIPRQLSTQIWRALLESKASEHGARMTAMDAATKNAGEMIGRLSLQYNRARQAAITKELMEIVSGAEAQK
jgi:F-type H+-transporting ATPase subunit gamma